MFYTCSKLFTFMLSPTFWIVFLFIAYFLLMRYKIRKYILTAAIGLLFVFTNPNIYNVVSGWWEGHRPNPDKVLHYDGIIVLGGGVAAYCTQNEKIKFNQNSDRLFTAIELFKEGKADHLIFSGGSKGEVKEGQVVKDYLKSIDFPTDSALIEWKSLNTHENAVETSRLLKSAGINNGKFLLVTSAYHIKRSMECFEKQGIHVTPYSTDFIKKVSTTQYASLFLPSTEVLNKWKPILKEWIGIIAYRMAGYI